MPPLLLALLVAVPPSFGPFEAETLAGDAVRVPDRLPGAARVILVAFERDRADALDASWLRLLPLEREVAGLQVFQAPVIGDVNPVLRAVVLGSQRLLLPADRRTRYVPLFVDRQLTMAALGVTDPRACLALMVSGAAVTAVLPDACAPDLPARVRAALAEAERISPLPPGP